MRTATDDLRPSVTKNWHRPDSGAANVGGGRPAWALWASGGLALMLGYVDLIRGGITLGPILLVVAYCVIVPLAIWRSGQGAGIVADNAPYKEAAAAAATVLGLYAITLAPTTAMWDTSEYIAAAYTVGLPHPPGNPLFVLIGRVFSLLPIAPTVALRLNVLAALGTAVAAGGWYLITHRILLGFVDRPWQRSLGAAAGTLIGATAFTVWNQSVVSEKVYTVAMAGMAVTSWLMLRWSDVEATGRRSDRHLLLVAYLIGLGYTNQMAAFMVLPAAGILVLSHHARTLLRGRLVLVCLLALIGGITVFATQPIRAAYGPPINEGEPTACVEGTGPRVDCTFSRTTLDRFMYNFNREQYGKPALTARQAPFGAQLGMWWLYFKWQWLRDAYGTQSVAQSMLASLFLILGVSGGVAHWRHDRRTFAYVGTLIGTLSVGLVYYMNFKYGASQAPALGELVPREVRDRDYFFIWSYSSWGIWAGVGLVALWRTVGSFLGGNPGNEPPNARAPRVSERGWQRASPVLLIALIPLITNATSAPRNGETDARDFAIDLLNSVEPYGILVTAGDNDSFPLWYAQEVEGVRRDVLVATNELLNTDWHLRHVVRRPVHAYDAARGPAIFRDREWRRPERRALRMTLAEADSLPPYVPVDRPMTFARAGVRAVITPDQLPKIDDRTGYLSRSDIAVLRMITDSWPERPIYFSRTAGSQPDQLGLTPHLVTQGLVRKLVASPASAVPALMRSDDGWYDLERSRALWAAYRGTGALASRDGWIDRASISIPYVYVSSGMQLAAAEAAAGNTEAADSVRDLATRIAGAVRLIATP